MDWRAKVELFEQIRREYEFGIGTIAGVAKKLKVHRRMVREAMGSAIPKRAQEDGAAALEDSGGSGVRGSDSGSGQESAAETAAYGAPDLGTDTARAAGMSGM